MKIPHPCILHEVNVMYEFFYLGKYVFNTSRKLIKNLNSTIIYYGIIYYQDFDI